jgi:hypothetical protein
MCQCLGSPVSQAGIDLMPTFATLRDWALRYESQLAD